MKNNVILIILIIVIILLISVATYVWINVQKKVEKDTASNEVQLKSDLTWHEILKLTWEEIVNSETNNKNDINTNNNELKYKLVKNNQFNEVESMLLMMYFFKDVDIKELESIIDNNFKQLEEHIKPIKDEFAPVTCWDKEKELLYSYKDKLTKIYNNLNISKEEFKEKMYELFKEKNKFILEASKCSFPLKWPLDSCWQFYEDLTKKDVLDMDLLWYCISDIFYLLLNDTKKTFKDYLWGEKERNDRINYYNDLLSKIKDEGIKKYIKEEINLYNSDIVDKEEALRKLYDIYFSMYEYIANNYK